MSYHHTFESTLPSTARYHHNLKTIQRHDPGVLYVFHQFSYMQLFVKDPEIPSQWNKVDTEGPMFIVARQSEPKYCMLLLNRYGTDNFVRPITASDTVLPTLQVLVQWKSGITQEVIGFWCNDKAELAEFKVATERLIICDRDGIPYVPDVDFISSAAWGQDQSLQVAREHLLQGLLDQHDQQTIANGYAPSVAHPALSVVASTPFQEPDDDPLPAHNPVAGPSVPPMTPVDSLFAKLVGPGTPSSLPSAFDSPVPAPSQASTRTLPAAPTRGTREKERKGRELLDQIFASASAVPAPTPPPPAPEHRSRMISPQAPQPQVLNVDVLQTLLGFRSTPHVESDHEEDVQQQLQHLSVDDFEPDGARTPVVVHKPIPQRLQSVHDPHANGNVDTAAVVDAAADLLSRRRDPVLGSAQEVGVLDKNTFGRRLVELIHTDKQFMIDLHQEYLRRV